MLLKVKLLIFNILRKPLIFRVFASGEESVHKYALIFWGRTGNQDGKTKIRLQIESRPFCFIQEERNDAGSQSDAHPFPATGFTPDFYRPVFRTIKAMSTSVNKPFQDIAVFVYAAVAEEWPPAAHLLTARHINVYHRAFLFVASGTPQHLTLRTYSH